MFDLVIFSVFVLVMALILRKHYLLGFWWLTALGLASAVLVYTLTFYFQASSYEIISGQITNKDYAYDPVTYTYPCGPEGKITCYASIPRWKWTVISDVGSDYSEYTDIEAPPSNWKAAKIGDPFAHYRSFINYQYVNKQSVIFNQDDKYAGWLPDYPKITDGYRINRCLSAVVTCEGLGQKLETAHKRWGHAYQVNVLVVIVEDQDVSFANALNNAWIGGKKNDAILILSIDRHREVKSAFVLGRSTSNKRDDNYADFSMILKDQASRIGLLDDGRVISAIETALPFFEREDLRKYDFMAGAYTGAPLWLMLLHTMLIGMIMFCVAAWYGER